MVKSYLFYLNTSHKIIGSWNDYGVKSQRQKKVEGCEALRIILQNSPKSDFDVARGISLIEEHAIEITTLKSFTRNLDLCGVSKIGITGAPGVGKSTFMNMLIPRIDLSSHKVAIIAIDPSSRISKGAILGDRIRITQNAKFDEIYFRSMATRGAYGGMNASAEAVLFFLNQCGFTLIFVETVGVGQNEVEVASYVDCVIHIVDSNAGDEVQMEKAGVMEVGDIYFVNKRENKENLQFISSLKTFAANSIRMSGKSPAVVVGSVLSGEGFEEIVRLLNLFTANSNNLDCEKMQ